MQPSPSLTGRPLSRLIHTVAAAVAAFGLAAAAGFAAPLGPTGVPEKPDAIDAEIAKLKAEGYELIDFHAHLKGGLTIEQLVAHQKRTGIRYGVAVNCGLGFPITTDAGANDFFRSMQGQPVYIAMQAEGREWMRLFSTATVARFDYVFTDGMTLFDHRGKRTRLWIKEEVEIPDKQAFMEHLTATIARILREEPIDIYVNPTFLPAVIAAEYDALWTPERMRRVIEAARAGGVAIEINCRYRIPSATFIKLAKQAGLKFTFGTNNTDMQLGRCEYGLEMIRACGLKPSDFWKPKPDGQKPIQVLRTKS